MKAVCEVLGLARSHVHAMLKRPASWHDRRLARSPQGDARLLEHIRHQLADLPSYGYRRVCALVNRNQLAHGEPRVNAKRVYRIMASHALLLPRSPRRQQSSPARHRPGDGECEQHTLVLRWL